MQALCYQHKYSVSYTLYNADPYNKGDGENGWPNNIGVPTYYKDDLGTSLRSRFALPSAPWSGSDNAMLDIFVRYGTISDLGQENFDPPEGFVFVGPPFAGDPWRRWESSYDFVCLGGPYMWDRYTYRASGIYVHPSYRHIMTATQLKAAGAGILPIIAALLALSSTIFAASATSTAPGRRRRKPPNNGVTSPKRPGHKPQS